MDNTISEHIDIAEKDSNVAHELLVVKNKVEWWRLYKGTQANLWSISYHSKKGWENGTSLTSEHLKEKVIEMKSLIYGFQHRTPLGILIFKPTVRG